MLEWIERLYQHHLGIKWIIICFIFTQCTTQPEVNEVAEVTLAGGFYQDSALQFDAQRSVNMYPEINNVDGGKGVAKLSPVSGLKNIVSISTASANTPQNISAVYSTSDDRVFYIYKSLGVSLEPFIQLIEIFENGTVSAIGSLDLGPVDFENQTRMSDNGVVLCVVTGTKALFYNLETAAFGEITDAAFPEGVVDVAFKDTYFIWVTAEEGRFYISSSYAYNPADCIDATEFGTVESSADDLVGIVARTNEILIFGTKTIEPFYNNANVDFPWARNNGGIQDIGTLARLSIATINNDIFFLGSNKDGFGIVYVLKGYTPVRVSTNAIESRLSEATDLSDVIAYTYQEEGSYFYVLTIPGINTTFAYDVDTGLWHERAVLNAQGGYDRFPGGHSAFAWGKNLLVIEYFFTYESLEYKGVSAVYYNSDTYNIEFGNAAPPGETSPTLIGIMPRERTLTHQTAENKNVIYNKFELDVQKGVGLVTGIDNDVDPVIELSMSRDGGVTWGEPMQMNIGKLGEYSKRARKKRLGKSRDTVFKLYSSSAVQMEWFKAYIEYEVLGD